MYREYLDPSWRAEFDAWRGAYRNPSKKLLGTKKGGARDELEAANVEPQLKRWMDSLLK